MTLFSLKFICFRSFGCHGVRLKSSELVIIVTSVYCASSRICSRWGWNLNEQIGSFARKYSFVSSFVK